nr:RNA-directed DNA polymerase, eukaryota [Tanacetum cinerariifolium]
MYLYTYAVQQCFCMHDPREPHFLALKRILRYVRGTLSFGLQLYSSSTSTLVAYSDADWAGCPTTRELHTPLSTATIVYCDNVSAVYLSSNPVQHQRTKHIEIDIHFVRDLISTSHIRVLHVPSHYQFVDIFTKRLPTALFDEFLSSLSVHSSPAQTAGMLVTVILSMVSVSLVFTTRFVSFQPHQSCELMEEISDSNQGRNQNIKSQGVSTEKRKILHEQSFEFPSSQPRQSCELMEEISDSNQGRNQNIKSPGASTKKRKILHEQSFEFQSSQPHQSCELIEEISDSNQGWNQNLKSPVFLGVPSSGVPTISTLIACKKPVVLFLFETTRLPPRLFCSQRIPWFRTFGSDTTVKSLDAQKYKGVVPQLNGYWGAQLYTNNQRIWLGTFKTKKDAAMAYDRASIKLRSYDSPRNFPWSQTTDLEAKEKTDKEKDDDLSVQKNYDNIHRLLFEKELTPSDVGKLSRLVIPKKFAVAYFPPVPANDHSEGFVNDELGMETQVRYMESNKDEGIVEDREISDELHPHHFGRELRKKLVSNLMKDVEGTCNGRDGFVVTITGIEDIGKGSIRDGTGFVTFSVKYSCVVFLPFKGEILEAIVTMVNKMGFFAEAGRVQIFVSNHVRKHRNIINVPYLRYQRQSPRKHNACPPRNIMDHDHRCIDIIAIALHLNKHNVMDSNYTTLLLLPPLSPQAVNYFCEEAPNDDRASDIEEVSETNFGDNLPIPINHIDELEKQQSEDPFNIYKLLRKQPGDESHEEISVVVNAKVMNNSQDVYKEASCDNVDKHVVKKGGSVLGVIEDMIRVGKAIGLGHKMKKEWIKELPSKNKFNFMAIQETKTHCVNHMDEATVFKKDYATISDNFVAIYRTWLPSNSKVLFVAIYATHQVSYKWLLWDYVSTLIDRWNREVVVLGDFNEVRNIDERRGSCFNRTSARVFDQFISALCLVDVKMEGYTFTWSHPSGSKMSKLDRFLVSEGIFPIFPSITVVFLDLHLLDHRPIILYEVLADFGPIPFWFYHSWISLEGFDAMDLNVRIRAWIKEKRSSVSGEKDSIKKELSDIDRLLDGSVYKVVTKVLANRLALDYLLDVLKAFGFGNIWCKWIRGTFSSAKALVLVNGSPTIEFPFHCRLKQGDPLSPYLFILIIESLNMSFTHAIDKGVFKGVHLHGSTSISHLFYADDIMFIGEWSDDNLKGIINILQCFFLASGLKINIQKSQVLGVGVPSSIVMQAASSIGCGVLHKQFRYLGAMVGECMCRHNAWASTMDKLRSRLSKWKVKTLSIGERLTLLKAVLGASPLYNMSIFNVPKGILNSMEAIRSKFFNAWNLRQIRLHGLLGIKF